MHPSQRRHWYSTSSRAKCEGRRVRAAPHRLCSSSSITPSGALASLRAPDIHPHAYRREKNVVNRLLREFLASRQRGGSKASHARTEIALDRQRDVGNSALVVRTGSSTQLISRLQSRCVYCGATDDLTADLDPRLRGDHRAATIDDCVTACRRCTSRLLIRVARRREHGARAEQRHAGGDNPDRGEYKR